MFPIAEPITKVYPPLDIVVVTFASAAFAALLLDNYVDNFFIRKLDGSIESRLLLARKNELSRLLTLI